MTLESYFDLLFFYPFCPSFCLSMLLSGPEKVPEINADASRGSVQIGARPLTAKVLTHPEHLC